MDNLAQFESDLWEAADNLRANSKLTSSDYFMPVLGIIFLRHAANRFEAAAKQIEEDQTSGKMPKRKILPGRLHSATCALATRNRRDTTTSWHRRRSTPLGCQRL